MTAVVIMRCFLRSVGFVRFNTALISQLGGFSVREKFAQREEREYAQKKQSVLIDFFFFAKISYFHYGC